MKNNTCFYCEIRGHHTKDCHKKQANCSNFSGQTNNPSSNGPTICTSAAPIMVDADHILDFLKENMDLLDEDTKLSIIESLMPEDFIKAQN